MSNLLDKITIVFVNYEKDLEFDVYTGSGCSGSVHYKCNDSHTGVIYKIEEINTEYYNFYEPCEDNYYEKVGVQKHKTKLYYVTGWDKPLSESEIEYYKNKQNE